ncbi:MAG: HK97 gp10 family phage protein [Actinobacteria bacterium]|nr:HK97 gp10 family phage protein [Actinomycetota bacterium]
MAEIKWYGEQVKTEVKRAAAKAIMDCALDLLGKSVELAPVDQGDLRANGSVTPNNVSALKTAGNNVGEMIIRVGFNLPYAEVQHERLDYSHPKGGQAKYLEQPFEANVAKYQQHIKTEVKRAAAKD